MLETAQRYNIIIVAAVCNIKFILRLDNILYSTSLSLSPFRPISRLK